MRQLKSILGDQRRYKGLQEGINTVESLKKIKENWGLIMGKLSDQVSPVYLRNNELTVTSSNPMWVSEIDFFKADILKKIEELLGKRRRVKSLRVQSSFSSGEQKTSPKPIEAVPSDLSFEEKIAFIKRRKLNKGFSLCSQCGKVMCKEDICTFCRCGRPLDNPQADASS